MAGLAKAARDEVGGESREMTRERGGAHQNTGTLKREKKVIPKAMTIPDNLTRHAPSGLTAHNGPK